MIRSIRRAAVIGSGAMGGALAAHIANAGIPVYLLDIVPTELTSDESAKGLTLEHPTVRNRIVNTGLENAKKSSPAALFTPEVAELITVGNLEDNIGWLGEADWILEAVVEDLAVKRQLMATVEAIRKPGSVVSSNTSGIPITAIAAKCGEDFKAHFLGTHFFNPPRYMKLLEIIPTASTLPEVVELIARFGEQELGKGVVRCKDTPAFLANRLLTFFGNFVVSYAVENGYSVEEVDAMTGPILGRPKTASFRLFDLIGADIAFHVSEYLYQAAPNDEQREHLRPPEVVRELVNRGWLGDKKGQGFYRVAKKDGARDIYALDLRTMEYHPSRKVELKTLDEAWTIKSLPERLRFLVNADDRVGSFVWDNLSRLLAYSAMRIPEIADDIVSVDNAIKWGFSHQMGPFEIWDALGVGATVERMEADGVAVAPWIKEMLQNGYERFYRNENGRTSFYELATREYRELSLRPEFVVIKNLKERGKELKSNESASLIDMGDGVLLLEFHSKMNSLDSSVGTLMLDAVREVEENYEGLVIGNQGDNFCVGANIYEFAVDAQQGQFEQVQQTVKQMQDAVTALRHCLKPVVAAPFGMALGGGAEVSMAASRIVAAAETYMGQVEVGLGLLPAGGGCKELLRRVVSPVARMSSGLDVFPLVQKVFELVAMGKVSTSAADALQMGFLTQADRIVMNKDALLYEAKRAALDLAASGYRPPARTRNIYAIGERGLAVLKIGIHHMLDAGYISEHDAKIARKIAYVLCGGELTSPQWVDEEYILGLEREAFVSLCGEPKTLERIWHMLRVGKPLRN